MVITNWDLRAAGDAGSSLDRPIACCPFLFHGVCCCGCQCTAWIKETHEKRTRAANSLSFSSDMSSLMAEAYRRIFSTLLHQHITSFASACAYLKHSFQWQQHSPPSHSFFFHSDKSVQSIKNFRSFPFRWRLVDYFDFLETYIMTMRDQMPFFRVSKSFNNTSRHFFKLIILCVTRPLVTRNRYLCHRRDWKLKKKRFLSFSLLFKN